MKAVLQVSARAASGSPSPEERQLYYIIKISWIINYIKSTAYIPALFEPAMNFLDGGNHMLSTAKNSSYNVLHRI